jgi:hypothetical protein
MVVAGLISGSRMWCGVIPPTVLSVLSWGAADDPSEGFPEVSMREIAEVVGRGLKVAVVSFSPEEAPAHFGWLAMFAGYDMPASSAQTQLRLGWHPTGPGLIADLQQMRYF